jgi:signal transduction histidine kinase
MEPRAAVTRPGRRLGLASVVLLSLIAGAPAGAAPEPRRVLLLHSFDGQFAPFDYVAAAFRREMSLRSPEPIEFYEISLQPARFTEAPPEGPIVDYILAMFARQRVDLVVPIGGPAAVFAKKNRARIFPETPMLLTGVDLIHLQGIPLADNEAAIAVTHNPGQLLEDILVLLPETKHVFVVLGNSVLERFWRHLIADRFKVFEGRLTFTWSDGLSFPEMAQRCAALPPNSVILFLVLSVDARNVPIAEAQGLPELHDVANAPIFGLHSSQLGRGVVGGSLVPMDVLSSDAATAALRMLAGEPGRSIQIPVQPRGPPIFDWRELRRWNIDEQRLPPGSIIRFRQPTLLDQYGKYIATAAALWLLVSLLLLALLSNMVRRRRAERSLQESADRLQGILDTAIEGILTVDEKGVIESVNAAAEQMFGYPAPEAVGQQVSALICGATGRRKDGSTFPIDVGVREIARAERRGHTHFVRDITERTRMEELGREFSRRLLEAQESERARVARELHDDVTQRLALLTIELSRHDSTQDPSSRASTLHAVRDELVRVGEDVHALAYRLHPALLDRMGLARALKVECERFSRQQSIRVGLSLESLPQEIPQAIALGLFRIAQEALTNVSRHAHASAAEVALKASGLGLQLVVTDTGVGFDPTKEPSPPSLGLASMRERVRLLGGDLAIESQPGRGTTVRAWVPLSQDT